MIAAHRIKGDTHKEAKDEDRRMKDEFSLHPSSFRLHPLFTLRRLGAAVAGGKHLAAIVVAAFGASAMRQNGGLAMGAGRGRYCFWRAIVVGACALGRAISVVWAEP